MSYIIGDIHGCYHTLIGLMNQLPLEKTDKIIFLGDYIDRGLYSKQVVEYVKSLTESGQAIALMGNHERMCLDTFDHRMWLHNGGDTTLDSYDTRPQSEREMPYPMDEDLRADWLRSLPKVSQDHLNWMESLPTFYEDEKYFYVHAGINPNYPLEQQSEQDLLWIRNPFLNSDRNFGKTIVFGHTPLKSVLIKPNKIGIDTGCVFGYGLTAFNTETNEFFNQPLDERDKNEYSKIDR